MLLHDAFCFTFSSFLWAERCRSFLRNCLLDGILVTNSPYKLFLPNIYVCVTQIDFLFIYVQFYSAEKIRKTRSPTSILFCRKDMPYVCCNDLTCTHRNIWQPIYLWSAGPGLEPLSLQNYYATERLFRNSLPQIHLVWELSSLGMPSFQCCTDQ